MSDKLAGSSSSFFVGGCLFLFIIILFDLTTETLISLFEESDSDTLSFGEADHGVLAFSDAENVSETGGKNVTSGVLDVGNLV